MDRSAERDRVELALYEAHDSEKPVDRRKTVQQLAAELGITAHMVRACLVELVALGIAVKLPRSPNEPQRYKWQQS